MIFSKVTNEYKENDIAIKDITYKIFNIVICYVKFATTNVNVINDLNTNTNNKEIKGFKI